MSTAYHGYQVLTPPTFGGGNGNCAAPIHTEPSPALETRHKPAPPCDQISLLTRW